MKRTAWWCAMVLLAGGCGGNAGDTTEPGIRAANSTIAIALASTPPDVPTSRPTTSQATTSATTSAPTTPPPTTAPVDPCERFQALGGYQRMMRVKRGNAPTGEACRELVYRSLLALNTYQAGLELSAELARTDRTDRLKLDYCNRPAEALNVFGFPVIFWGVTMITNGDTAISYEPFVTEVIPPGESASFTLPNEPEKSCKIRHDVVLAPVRSYAQGIDSPPAPSDGALASDDPNVWGPALLGLDVPKRGTPAPQRHVGRIVNYSEDIHSHFVGDFLRPLGPDDLVFTGGEYTYTICASEPADLGEQVGGEYAWLVFAAQDGSFGTHQIGLFSRGTDRRWRFLGDTQSIDDEFDPENPCSIVPRSTG